MLKRLEINALAFGCAFALTAPAGLLVAPSAATAQELDIWTISYSSDPQRNALAAAEEEFEKQNPGVDVKITMRGTDDHKTALRVSAGSDRGPDIYFSWAGRGLGGEYVLAGLDQDLTKYYEQYGWADRLSEPALAFVDDFAEGMHGVPFRFSGEAVYYDKRAFEKAGIAEEPKTYDELVAAAEKLKEAGIPAFTFGGTVNWHLMRLMDNILEAKCGLETHDALMNMEADWSTTPCAKDSFAEMQMWGENYILSPFMGIDQKQSVSLFVGQRAAMALEGDWLVNQIAEAGVDLNDYGVFPFPNGTDRLYGFAEYLYVSSKTEHPDLAAKFIDMFTSTAFQDRIKGAFGALSVNTDVELGPDASDMYKEWLTIFDEATGTYVNGDQAFPLDVTTEYFRVINEVATGNMEPTAAADAMATFIGNRS